MSTQELIDYINSEAERILAEAESRGEQVEIITIPLPKSPSENKR